SNRWLLAYAQALSEADAGQWLDFRFADGQAGRMTRREMLFHLVNHGTYHRGAIGHALDLAGAPRPADTYTVFIHAVQPQRRGAASA
ncbi:DinB family protein, partial [Pseudomonas citronellolis]|uniref:DinB family protein n=1 Tax=Pseudomonas citronellolis TaxID=53408 RepID=UPI0023E45C87